MLSLLLPLALTGCLFSNEPPEEPRPAQVQQTPPPSPRPSPTAVAEADAAEEEAIEEEEAPAVEEEAPVEAAAPVEPTPPVDGAVADAPGKDSDEPAAEEPDEPAAEEPAAEPDEPAAEEPPAGATTYTLDPSQGLLWVQVFKDPDTVGAGLSHDHIVAAYGWSGTVTWDADDASKCAVSIKVPVSGLDPDAPSLRRMVGYEGDLSESQRGEVKGKLQGKGQLYLSKYALISFTSTSCSGASGVGAVAVTGDLSIRGQKKSITVNMTVAADGSSFTAQGGFNAKATDFGFEPFSAMMGALKNKNKMTFGVNVVGVP